MSPKKSKTTKSSLKKQGTMAATAAAGEEFLKRTSKTVEKPKLSKTRTMQNTAEEGKALLGNEVLADTRTETKRRQAAANAKAKRKPALKRLGTMAKTASEGKAYVKKQTTKAGRKKRTSK